MMLEPESLNLPRYQRQELFPGLGRSGQRGILNARVLIVGLGGVGSWLSELLVRAGVSMLRLVDDDTVDWTNIARQAMYDELDAAEHSPKVYSAAEYLGRINHNLDIEPKQTHLYEDNIARLADGMDLILDGTSDWSSRFLINDYAVKMDIPWVFASAVRDEGQVLPILPGKTACLRCVFETPPTPEEEKSEKASRVGILGTAVAAVAAMEANEALKILAGRTEALSPYLTKLDLWSNQVRQIPAVRDPKNTCPCCGQRRFDFLEG
ncbi:MAG: HesA/MoeB/ThiF family protein [Phycisphaerae bacterium]|nr:HesA/MoeB/ThiF family protein [Phycisphaerae bacterium]